MVHGFERPKHEEMKHLAVDRSVFTFPRAQVFQSTHPVTITYSLPVNRLRRDQV